jgi:hypothetical protein
LSTSNRNTEEKIAGFGAGGIDVVDQIEMLQAGSSFRPPDHGGGSGQQMLKFRQYQCVERNYPITKQGITSTPIREFVPTNRLFGKAYQGN